MSDVEPVPSRRTFLRALLALPMLLAARLPFAAVWAPSADAWAETPRPGAAPTPDCGDDDEPTPSETAGPFFKPRSPQRKVLVEPGMKGRKLVLTGRVFSHACTPVAGALLDFWHADDDGEYDNAGFRLRGHQFTDRDGRYRLETIVPGIYTGRTRHIHVRVQAPQGRVLTTQLYFPGEPRNESDGLFRSDLLVSQRESGAVRQAQFHFMVSLG